jgi:hypothetical protein
VANLRINTLHEIEFQNFRRNVAPNDLPYILAQLGDWDMGGTVEAGVVIDAAGPHEYPPILSAADARKLAKWLNNAADALDGELSNHKKQKKRNHNHHYDDDDEENEYSF